MEPMTESSEMDFRQSLFTSYANIAIMEMKLYNSNSTRLRPSHKETLYLYTIWSKNGCTASDLVELFDSSKALVSQTILGMEEKGYIVRERDPKDNRRQIIRLSPQRLEESKVERNIIERAIRQISKNYSEEEIAKASEIMTRLTDTMVNIVINDDKKH